MPALIRYVKHYIRYNGHGAPSIALSILTARFPYGVSQAHPRRRRMMMLRKVLVPMAALLLALSAPARSEDAKPAAPPKCSEIPPKSFPASPPAAAAKQGRVAACLPAKTCVATEQKAIGALANSFCGMNNFAACSAGTCDKPTLACMPEYREKGSTGVKLSNCVARPSKIACPKEGEEICLCDLEVEAKGSVQCGCACQLAPTPTPSVK
jgi:hypothetical protein